jgi:O-6-methylguanine DNA methyltransferase
MSATGLGIACAPYESALGTVLVAYRGNRICGLRLASQAPEFERELADRFEDRIYRLGTLPEDLARSVGRRLGGERTWIEIDLSGLTPFEQEVLAKTQKIPYGEVRPYAWIAREIGSPRAVRAVGSALAHNPIPLVIPCHRVVRSDGRLGQYSLGGGEAKRTMLRAEGSDPEELERLARDGVRYLGSDTTHIFCFPTCRHARRTTDRHLVTFKGDAEAAASGYRPCRVCRPVTRLSA